MFSNLYTQAVSISTDIKSVKVCEPVLILRGLLLGLSLILISPFVQAEAISVIVSSQSKLTPGSVKQKDIRNVFLRKTSKLNGVAVDLIAQSRDRSITLLFNQGVLNKTSDQMRAYWSRMMFSGKASPPPELEDDQAVKLHVAGHETSISYIKKSMLDDTVKSILDIEIND